MTTEATSQASSWSSRTTADTTNDPPPKMTKKNIADIPPPPPTFSPAPTNVTVVTGQQPAPLTPPNSRDPGSHSPTNNPITSSAAPLLVEIEEGTPAAEALKANADVRVSALHKLARSTKSQTVVRALKSAARTASGQPGHASDRRGAPPFVAPKGTGTSNLHSSTLASGQPPPTILEGDYEGDSDGQTKSKASDKLDSESTDGDSNGSQDADSITSTQLETSFYVETSGRDEDRHARSAPNAAAFAGLMVTPQSYRQLLPHITHAALPAAIAAACRAGEELERKRATTAGGDPVATPDATTPVSANRTTPLMTPLSSLFKSTSAMASQPGDIKGAFLNSSLQMISRQVPSNRMGISDGAAFSQSVTLPVSRRSSSAERLPSEISMADTEPHANVRNCLPSDSEDLSDDGESGVADPQKKAANVFLRDAPIEPLTVAIPDQLTMPETEVGDGSKILSDDEDGSEVMATKARKKKSRRFRKQKDLDDDNFHFHGHKSVKKWVRRRKRKEERKDPRSYVKGKVIDGKHELYTMSIAVMLGMRTSIGRTNLQMSETTHNDRRWLDNDDFMAVEKYLFPPRGSEITPPHQLSHTFKFKDYSPLAFAYLRRMFGVNEYEFLLSVCGNANYIEFQSNAKSGQFFFYSTDGKYMIKTMTNAESKFLRRILPHYFRHCALNPNTLVAKFLGMYRVKLYHLRRNVKFMVMKSVYDTDKHLHQLFDVKGSSTGRDAKPGDAVKKDNDVRRALPEGAFVLEPGLRERVRKQVITDCQWLRAMKIMDYSMLVGVHHIPYRTQKVTGSGPVPSRRNLQNPGRTKSSSLTQHDADPFFSRTPSDRSKSSFQPSVRMPINDDGDELSHNSFDASHATLDNFLDDDDDGSYLDGALNYRWPRLRPGLESSSASDDAMTSVRVVKNVDFGDDDSSRRSKHGPDKLIQQAIEDMYWPFHRYYDIHGRRRLYPIREPISPEKKKLVVNEELSHCDSPQQDHRNVVMKALFPINVQGHFSSYHTKQELPSFERPLSERKDSGFMMDLSGIELPLKLSKPGAPNIVEYCDGKIFYMGIIDILQQFNIRKRFEARYRRMSGKGWDAASCVHPNLYADRFLQFFDEYTENYLRSAEITENLSISDSASNITQLVANAFGRNEGDRGESHYIGKKTHRPYSASF